MKLEINIPNIDTLEKIPKNKTAELPSYVYILWNKDDIVYIGETRALNNRFSYHKRTKEYTHYSLIVCYSVYERKAIESYLIEKHNPKYNIKGTSNTNGKRGQPLKSDIKKRLDALEVIIKTRNTKSPTQIVKIMREEFGIETTRQTITKDLRVRKHKDLII